MEIELPTKLIAQRVVELLTDKKRESLHEAVAMLEAFFENQPDRVARAYELAWLVVLKRNLTNAAKHSKPKLSPDADWMALRASKAADVGNLPQAFSLLRTANNTGATGNLCRRVVFQILRQLPPKDRITQISYSPKGAPRSITSVEVGRVKGSGLMVIRNPDSKFDISTKIWKRPAGTWKHDPGGIFLKNEDEIRNDVEIGSIEYQKVGAAPPTFDRINWTRYLEDLLGTQAGVLTRDAA